jgi:hypothetical protein
MQEQDDVLSFRDRQSIQIDLDHTLMTALCRALDTSRLPPMTVMNAMAAAFGSVYRQVAVAHQSGQCPCGWHPAPARDVDTLQSIFRAAAAPQPSDRLLTMPVQGRA